MEKNTFKITVGKENLAVITIKNDDRDPAFFFLHGGGMASYKELIDYIALPLTKNNISSVSFDFSGHGESSGDLKKSSLKKRTLEATAVINFFPPKEPLIMCGASMGGYVAIKMLELFTVDTLILFCPALYDGNAFDVQFDEGFTQIIRSHQSWKNTDVLKTLENFTGNLLIIMGDQDEVIPSDVIDLLIKHTVKARKKELYIIPKCPHKIFQWIENRPNELHRLQEKIAEYLL